METATQILAIAGFIAVVSRMLRALLRVLTRGADAFIAREIAGTRAQRGDLTGFEEAKAARNAARLARYRSLGIFSVWIGLLVVPSLTPWPRLLYATYSLLWLLPRRSRRVLPT